MKRLLAMLTVIGCLVAPAGAQASSTAVTLEMNGCTFCDNAMEYAWGTANQSMRGFKVTQTDVSWNLRSDQGEEGYVASGIRLSDPRSYGSTGPTLFLGTVKSSVAFGRCASTNSGYDIVASMSHGGDEDHCSRVQIGINPNNDFDLKIQGCNSGNSVCFYIGGVEQARWAYPFGFTAADWWVGGTAGGNLEGACLQSDHGSTKHLCDKFETGCCEAIGHSSFSVVQYTNTGVDCGCATWQGPFDDDYYDPVLRGDPDPNNFNGGQSPWDETEKLGIPFYFERYDP